MVFDLEPVDSVTVTTLMDNVTDAFMPDQGPARRPPLPIFDAGRQPATTMVGGDVPEVPLADGGFSVLVEVAKNGARHRILFDAGTTPDGVVENMRRLEVIEEQQPSFLFNRSVLVTGEIPRTTGYEAGFPPQQAWLDDRWQPDPLVLDDQAVIVDIKDKGLLVITGCGHAGIVNICRYARRLTKERALYAIMGGFHLNGPIFEPLIPRVLDDVGALAPSVVVPAHCTGWRAQHAMAARFGEAFIPNTVGTRFEL